MLASLKRLFLDNIVEIAIFIVFSLLYIATTSHGIVEGDTGDFLSSAAVGGVPHQPGYPLYSFLTRIIFLLPFPNSAFAINAFSALFGALALTVVYKITYELTHNKLASLFATFALGTYESFWWYSLVAEIYALQIFLQALIIFFLIKDYKTKHIKYFYLAALCFGLGVSNHMTIIFTFPFFIYGFLTHKKELLKTFFFSGCMAFLGLLPYLYTLYAASHFPLVNWGRVTDAASFSHFFFRSDTGTFQLGPHEPYAPFIYNSYVFFFQNIFHTSWYIIPFFVFSLFLLNKKNWMVFLLFACWILLGPLFSS
jgi:4-amino-4-deoxy-L-arabinose transferase-like glycosyltransferase